MHVNKIVFKFQYFKYFEQTNIHTNTKKYILFSLFLSILLNGTIVKNKGMCKTNNYAN